jgi:hypothetical protein
MRYRGPLDRSKVEGSVFAEPNRAHMATEDARKPKLEPSALPSKNSSRRSCLRPKNPLVHEIHLAEHGDMVRPPFIPVQVQNHFFDP